uniref:Uncharacterized protein n=1 Tax=Phocoena sinus TaxID=42100 RepID=A0A8C9E3U0_PHOSS
MAVSFFASLLPDREEVWKQVFQELIREVKPWHTWKLTLDKSLLPNILKPGWTQYQQWTYTEKTGCEG